ncbi:hypothetical protein C8A03DRAFT_15383 [Achaetomium macrosporum]|uniref:Coiled-coil domain-containing protein 16 n=1 Tax=Achaetomium macrosporum TaxID=79813 RepID=A0AAN7C9Y5_9PEZI|nr:hypothetical protein C8A03DRAFT_15383 [Achaetomium macrosporum]
MADVRALLRQQRAARRIDHPHASYSDAGKLVCTVCNEPVKTEALWEGHLRSAAHRQRLHSLHQASTKNGSNEYAGFVQQTRNKRRLENSDEVAGEDDGAAPRKRNKADSGSTEHIEQGTSTPAKTDDGKTGQPVTPPLSRRTSGTPSAGVEMEIPSRPATPSAGGTPMSISTPKLASIARSPLIPDESATLQQSATTAPAPPASNTQPPSTTNTSTSAAATAAPIDEDEWAAFEADLIHGTGASSGSATKPALAAAAALNSDAAISAPVMSAAEVTAKSEEEERARRRALVDIQLEDEKEEATRALETEFEVMEELEARARKLRERREALRIHANGGGPAAAVAGGGAGDSEKGGLAVPGKENTNAAEPDDEEEDEDEEEMDDDWDGFRFRA